jgi:hypothetical protein
VSQEHWIQNRTLMDNVLFGHPYDEDRYIKVGLLPLDQQMLGV